jgi:hypothetical protein
MHIDTMGGETLSTAPFSHPGTRKTAPHNCGKLLYREFSPLDRVFDGILGKPVKPLVIKGLLGPDNGLGQQVKLILTGFADLTMANMKIITPHRRLLDRAFANIADNGFHAKLLLE